MLDRLETENLSKEIEKINRGTNSNEGQKIKDIEKQISECSNKNELFKDKIIRIIQGQSSFTREMLTGLIEEKKKLNLNK